MSTRRVFIKAAGGAGLGAAAYLSTAGAAGAAQKVSTAWVASMPKNMKLMSIANGDDGTESLGVVTPRGVVDVRATASALRLDAPLTLDELLQQGNAAGLQAVVDRAASSGVALLDESKIKYGRLFAKPGKIVCVGLNYRRHAKEIGAPEPRVPPLFNKYHNALTPHQTVVKLPPREVAYKFDYETELLIVIGKSARNVPESDALNYVAGYCTSNDFSARDLQTELPAGQWMIGKTLDQFAPIGPYFVSADLVGNPNDLKISTFVNGEQRQSSSTSDFIFNTQQIIAYISKHWTLEPGDIVFTGTPEGVILGYTKDKQVWLKPGDKVVSEIEKLGKLEFTLG